MSKEIAVIDHIANQDAVYKLWLTGNRNATAIAKELKLTRADVLGYIEESKKIARNDDEVKARAKEALNEYDASLNLVVQELWQTSKDADFNSDYKTKNSVLKNIADVERQRVETLQKAGLYDDASLGDELAEMEEKAEAIKQLLTAVAQQFPQTRELIMQGLGKIFDQPVGVVVEDTRPA